MQSVLVKAFVDFTRNLIKIITIIQHFPTTILTIPNSHNPIPISTTVNIPITMDQNINLNSKFNIQIQNLGIVVPLPNDTINTRVVTVSSIGRYGWGTQTCSTELPKNLIPSPPPCVKIYHLNFD